MVQYENLRSAVLDQLRIARRELRALRGRDRHIRTARVKGSTRLGTNYGGWTFLPALLNEHSVVYAAGVGDDISWDLALIERVGCTVHAFDPTPRCRTWLSTQTLPEQFQFHPWGVAASNGRSTFVMRSDVPGWSSYNMSDDVAGASEVEILEVRRVPTIMAELGHSHIDLLKMDIEGAEYEVIPQLLASAAPVAQLCIEFHFDGQRSTEVRRFQECVEAILDAGYTAFDRSPYGRELSFVQSSLTGVNSGG